MNLSAGSSSLEMLVCLLVCLPVLLLFLWGHKRYLKDKANRYYLDIPSELSKWAESQGILQEYETGRFYVASQQVKDCILEKLEQPFYKKTPIMTKHEVKNYRCLYKAATSLGLEVFTKVRMLDLLEPVVDKSSRLFRNYIRVIWSKHVDFVVWSPDTESVVCIVELDDASHQREDRKKRDEFVEKELTKAGYVYLHYFTIYQEKMYYKLRALKDSQAKDSDNHS